MDIYVRIKRKKTTYFIQAKPTDTILELKQKIEEDSQQSPEDMQILKNKGNGWSVIEDVLSVQEAEISNNEVLALCFKQGDAFEAVDITPYEIEMATGS